MHKFVPINSTSFLEPNREASSSKDMMSIHQAYALCAQCAVRLHLRAERLCARCKQFFQTCGSWAWSPRPHIAWVSYLSKAIDSSACLVRQTATASCSCFQKCKPFLWQQFDIQNHHLQRVYFITQFKCMVQWKWLIWAIEAVAPAMHIASWLSNTE